LRDAVTPIFGIDVRNPGEMVIPGAPGDVRVPMTPSRSSNKTILDRLKLISDVMVAL
jgi:hypothetical protein